MLLAPSEADFLKWTTWTFHYQAWSVWDENGHLQIHGHGSLMENSEGRELAPVVEI